MKVAVYGSLLSGLGNHGVLARQDAKLLGEDFTEPKYTMHSLSAYPAIVPGGSTAIKIEVYEVDENGLMSCNRLEGFYGDDNPQNYYDRETIQTKFGEAYIYYLREARTSPVVEDGDWRNWLNSRKNNYGY